MPPAACSRTGFPRGPSAPAVSFGIAAPAATSPPGGVPGGVGRAPLVVRRAGWQCPCHPVVGRARRAVADRGVTMKMSSSAPQERADRSGRSARTADPLVTGLAPTSPFHGQDSSYRSTSVSSRRERHDLSVSSGSHWTFAIRSPGRAGELPRSCRTVGVDDSQPRQAVQARNRGPVQR